jgi:hypothetical protein
MELLSTARPSNGQMAPATKTVKTVKTVTGQYLAKATVNYPSRQRADDAVRWLCGQLTIKPTVKLAAATFGVSAPLVAEARKRFEQRERAKRFNGGTTTLSDSAIEGIVREVGVDRIWRAVDKLTSPELPFVVAAE